MGAASHYTAESLYQLALICRDTARLERAADYFRRAIDVLGSQRKMLGGTEQSRTTFTEKYGNYYKEFIDLLLELHRREDAFGVLERSRAQSLLWMLAERDLVFAVDVPTELERERERADSAFDKIQRQIREGGAEKNTKEIEKSLSELRHRQAEIRESLTRASPKYASLRYPEPLDLADAQRALDRGSLLLSYSVAKEETFLFVVSPDSTIGPPLSVCHSADWREGAARVGRGPSQADRMGQGFTRSVLSQPIAVRHSHQAGRAP